MKPSIQRFIEEYVVDYNGAEAARRAGYAAASAKQQAYALLHRPDVIAAIGAHHAEQRKHVGMQVDEIINRLSHLARFASGEWQQLRALGLLMRHLGMFTAKAPPGESLLDWLTNLPPPAPPAELPDPAPADPALDPLGDHGDHAHPEPVPPPPDLRAEPGPASTPSRSPSPGPRRVRPATPAAGSPTTRPRPATPQNSGRIPTIPDRRHGAAPPRVPAPHRPWIPAPSSASRASGAAAGQGMPPPPMALPSCHAQPPVRPGPVNSPSVRPGPVSTSA